MPWPWVESNADISYYREFLNDFAAVRVYTSPTAAYTLNYSESAGDLTYYRKFMGNI